MEAKLVIFKPNGQRKDFPLVNATTVIGRGENCDLRVPLLSVSRRHCELIVAGESLKVKDLASSNGSYVNNKRVNETRLKPGDRLVVGPIVFTVQINGQPSDIHPVKTKGQVMAEEGEGAPDILNLGEIISQPGSSAGESGGEDFDPIAALEAMTTQQKKNKGQK